MKSRNNGDFHLEYKIGKQQPPLTHLVELPTCGGLRFECEKEEQSLNLQMEL